MFVKKKNRDVHSDKRHKLEGHAFQSSYLRRAQCNPEHGDSDQAVSGSPQITVNGVSSFHQWSANDSTSLLSAERDRPIEGPVADRGFLERGRRVAEDYEGCGVWGGVSPPHGEMLLKLRILVCSE